MISVYHNDDFLDYSFLNEEQARDRFSNPPNKIVKVAEVDTDDMDEAFRLTNHIDSNWCNGSKVACFVPGRSTSVGDVMEKDGVSYLVACVGFIKLKGI